MTNEIWKDIKDYEGYYQISTFGRIKSLSREKIMPNGTICFTKERILKPSCNKGGYYSINLYKNGERINHFVHRLVAKTFIPNLNNLPEVNHIKEFEKFNNCIENLEWCDKIYNNNYGTKKERQGNNNSKKVYQYNIEGNLIKVWITAKEREEAGYSYWGVSGSCTGKSITYNGFIWSYEEKTKEDILELMKYKRKIIQKTLDNKIIKIWNNLEEISKEFKISVSAISKCCLGKNKTSCGYKWEYDR